MKRHYIGWFAVLTLLLMGGNCSREKVESLNLMNEGVVQAESRRYTDAMKSLERATVLDPTNHQAFDILASVQMEIRTFSAASESLKRAIAIDPTVATYHEKLGTVSMELGEWKQAKSALEEALKIDDSLYKAHYKLGRVFEELEDPQNALYQYTDAIKKGPRFINSYGALGRLYADLGYADNAVRVLQSGLKVAAENSEEEASLHHLLGSVLQQQQKFDVAIAEFEKALSIVPSMRDALFSLGWTYSLQGNRKEATRYLEKFLMMAGSDAPPHYVQAARDRLAEMRTTAEAVEPAAEE